MAALCAAAAGCVSLEMSVSERGDYNPTELELGEMTAKALNVPSSIVSVRDKVSQTTALKKSGASEPMASRTVIYYNATISGIRSLCFTSNEYGKTTEPVCANVETPKN